MPQLTGLDNMFVRMERKDMPMHVAALCIYDSSTVPKDGLRYKDVLRYFEARLDRVPVFRRRLMRVPFGLDRPYWLEEGKIDVEHHVRHIALPHPGDWRQLCIQVARLHARPLDFTQPLWEAYLIEGLDNVEGVPPGSFAMYLKMHHAAVDGQGATAVLRELHTPTPHGRDSGEVHVLMKDRPPLLLEVAMRAAAQQARKIPRLARLASGAIPRVLEAGGAALKASRDLHWDGAASVLDQLRAMLQAAPRTRFGGKVSPHRVFEAIRLPMAELQAIRSTFPGTTLNDVLITVVSGALNKYLGEKGELPEQSLVAQIPISLRATASAAAVDAPEGNVVSSMLVPIRSEIAGAAARLRAVHESAAQAKSLTQLIGADLLPRLAQVTPERVTAFLVEKFIATMMNLTISNVRGSERPMYLAGAKAIAVIPVSIVTDGMGLNITASSYDDSMWISVVSCRAMMPDPAFFAECVRRSYADLRRAAVRSRGGKAAAGSGAAPARTSGPGRPRASRK